MRRLCGMILLATALPMATACRPQTRDKTTPDEPLLTRVSLEKRIAAGLGDVLIVDRAELADDDFELLASSPQLIRVEIRNNERPFGDAALVHLAKLPQLEWINLPCGEVTDAGLAAVAKLPKLRILNLRRCQITDAGLASLAPCERLDLLRFGSPHVTDQGIDEIGKIKSLRFLHLIDVPISDAGLEPIKSMTQLESLYIDGGNATDEGLSSLIKVRPDLHFHQDQQHIDSDPRRDDHRHDE
jgi:hypothetical protein